MQAEDLNGIFIYWGDYDEWFYAIIVKDDDTGEWRPEYTRFRVDPQNGFLVGDNLDDDGTIHDGPLPRIRANMNQPRNNDFALPEDLNFRRPVGANPPRGNAQNLQNYFRQVGYYPPGAAMVPVTSPPQPAVQGPPTDEEVYEAVVALQDHRGGPYYTMIHDELDVNWQNAGVLRAALERLVQEGHVTKVGRKGQEQYKVVNTSPQYAPVSPLYRPVTTPSPPQVATPAAPVKRKARCQDYNRKECERYHWDPPDNCRWKPKKPVERDAKGKRIHECQQIKRPGKRLTKQEKIQRQNKKPKTAPPRLAGKSHAWITKNLKKYSENELMQAYELPAMLYADKNYLIRLIIQERDRPARWHFRKNNCKNENRTHIEELDPRIECCYGEEWLARDPLIAYGTMEDYRCWNMGELIASFERRGPDGEIELSTPDFMTNDPYKYFPDTSLAQLRQLLMDTAMRVFREIPINEDGDPEGDLSFLDLLEEVERQMRILRNDLLRRIGIMRQYYSQLPAAQQDQVKRYLTWMFTAAQNIRGWDGPPNAYITPDRLDPRYPYAADSIKMNLERHAQNEILDEMTAELQEWVLNFPLISYDFLNEPHPNQEAGRLAILNNNLRTIDEVMGLATQRRGAAAQAQAGNYCGLALTDNLLQTGFYLITQIFQFDDMNAFNRFLREQLNSPNQPDFNPTVHGRRSGHVDPYAGAAQAIQ